MPLSGSETQYASRSVYFFMMSGCVKAFGGWGAPVREPVGVLFYDVDGAVGRAAVYDDVFNIRVALTEHREHGLLYADCRIITDGYNRYFKHL